MSRFPALILVLTAILLAACGGAPAATRPPEEAATAASTVPAGPGDAGAVPTAPASPPAAGITATPPASDGADTTPGATVPTEVAATPTGTPVATAAATGETDATASAGTAEPTGTAGSAAGGFPLTYTDAGGTEVTLEERPERIVSLFAVNNDTLFAIGAGDQIVAVDDFTTVPRGEDPKPSIGGGANFQFNVERIVSLRPDLVISSFGVAETVDKPLRDAGVEVVSLAYPTDLEQTYRHMRDLGRLTGHVGEAEREVRRIRRTAASIRARAADARAVRTYFETDASDPAKPFVATAPGFDVKDDLIALAGGRNVFADVESGQVSLEAIVRADPEVILLGNVRGSVPRLFLNPVTLDQVRSREGLRSVAAVRENRLVPINPDLTVPGPALNQGMRQVAAALHPEIFAER